LFSISRTAMPIFDTTLTATRDPQLTLERLAARQTDQQDGYIAAPSMRGAGSGIVRPRRRRRTFRMPWADPAVQRRPEDRRHRQQRRVRAARQGINRFCQYPTRKTLWPGTFIFRPPCGAPARRRTCAGIR
jgi:hypothetical protein